jgi:hypothetical protein
MTRSELVKFRVTPKAKSSLVRLAGANKKTVSALLRDQASWLTTGRSTDPLVRADLMAVRQLANVVLASIENVVVTQIEAHKVADAAHQMRRIADRRLGLTP